MDQTNICNRKSLPTAPDSNSRNPDITVMAVMLKTRDAHTAPLPDGLYGLYDNALSLPGVIENLGDT